MGSIPTVGSERADAPNVMEKMMDTKDQELIRFYKYGKLPSHSDMLGVWLKNALFGKRTYYFTDRDGNRVDGIPSDPKEFKNPYTRHYISNSDEDLLLCDVTEIKFVWDQWVLCRITCSHGEFDGTSDYFNITEALMRAVVEFNEADHPEKVDNEED